MKWVGKRIKFLKVFEFDGDLIEMVLENIVRYQQGNGATWEK